MCVCVFIFTFTLMFTCTSISNADAHGHVVSVRGRVGAFCWLRRYAENNRGHQIDSRSRARLVLTPFQAEDMKCRSIWRSKCSPTARPMPPEQEKRFVINFVCFLVLSKLVCARALHLTCILRNTFCGMRNRL